MGLSKMDEQGRVGNRDPAGDGLDRSAPARHPHARHQRHRTVFLAHRKRRRPAWEENTALANEANKRYATTESRLTNLKNTALLTAQQIGDDLNPTIQNLIDGATRPAEQIHGAGRKASASRSCAWQLMLPPLGGVADVGENRQRCGHIVHRHRQVCHCRGQGGRRLEGVLFDAVQIPRYVAGRGRRSRDCHRPRW